jgi:zeaxanthin glucosyltransferase
MPPAAGWPPAGWRRHANSVTLEHALAGALAARRQGARWATLATSAMELTRPYRALPGVERWIAERLAALSGWAQRVRPPAGRPAGFRSADDRAPGDAAGGGLLASPSLLLGCTTTALTGAAPLPAQAQLTGPVLGGRPAGPGAAWPAAGGGAARAGWPRLSRGGEGNM